MAPVKDVRELHLTFPMPDLHKYYDSKVRIISVYITSLLKTNIEICSQIVLFTFNRSPQKVVIHYQRNGYMEVSSWRPLEYQPRTQYFMDFAGHTCLAA